MGPYNAGPNIPAGPFNPGLDKADFKLCGLYVKLSRIFRKF